MHPHILSLLQHADKHKRFKNHKPMGPLATGSRQDQRNGRVPFIGTNINASKDVLGALAGNREAPARKQQDLVALVKTMYAPTHTRLLQRIRLIRHLAHTGRGRVV